MTTMEDTKGFNIGDIVIANKSYVHTDSVIRRAKEYGTTGVVERFTTDMPYFIEVIWGSEPSSYPCKPKELEHAVKLIHPTIKQS